MTSFEKHLIDKGFKRFTLNTKTFKLEYANGYLLSSMVNLDYRYLKGNIMIIFGLSEKNKPPTLIYPRPIRDNYSDDMMNRVLMKYSNNEILNAILNKKILE